MLSCPILHRANTANDYKLYENKPCTDENADDCQSCLETRIALAGHEIAYDEWGDSEHFKEGEKGEVILCHP